MQSDIIKIGDFYFNKETLTLVSDEVELPLEPKVGNLLIYLFQNKDRFVSLKELHEQVWSDAIVSDTAVRRAISKLRHVLGDDAENPRYIKSLHKRGYKLIASVGEKTSDKLVTSIGLHQVSDPGVLNVTGGQVTNQFTGTALISVKNILFSVVTIVVIAVAIVSVYELVRQSNPLKGPSKLTELPLTKLETLTSDKLSMALSSDKRLLAFTARSSESEPYTLYVKNLKSGEIRQLSAQSGHADFMSFVNNDTQVVYGEIDDRNVKLILTDIDSGNERQSRVIYSQQGGFIGDVSDLPEENSILVSIGMEKPEHALLYKINLETGHKEEVTTAVTDGIWDYIGQPSPDGKFLAYGRWANNNNQLLVVELETGAPVLTTSLTRSVLSMAWRDSSRLLLLDKNHLKELNINTGTVTELYVNSHGRAKDIVSVDYDKLLLQLDQPKDVRVGEAGANMPETFLWQRKTESGRMVTQYSWRSDSYVSMNNLTTGAEIALVNNVTGERQLLVQSEHPIFLHDTNTSKAQILYTEQGQLWLLDIATNNKLPITNASQYLLDTQFTADGKDLYYCERRQTKNNCFLYSLEKQQRQLLMENAEAIRPLSSGYIVARPDGSVEEVDSHGALVAVLPFSINYNTKYRLEASDYYVIWRGLETDSSQVVTHIYDRKTGKHQKYVRSYDVISAYFDLSKDGKHLLQHARTIRFGDYYYADL